MNSFKISIDNVRHRLNNNKSNIINHKYSPLGNIYPLYESYNKLYDYDNIKNSIKNWFNFSESVFTNINQVCNLLKIVYDNGTDYELQESINIINSNIIPYLKNPNEYKYNFNKLIKENNNLKPYIEKILDKITEQAECDRVIYNYDLISKRFNLNKVFTNILEENGIPNTMQYFCNLIDTYEMPLKTKYCVANEVGLLVASNYFSNKMPIKEIEESIIDYFIMNYGTNDIPKSVEILQDAVNKDRFITEDANKYLNYIIEVYNDNIDSKDYEKEIINNINNNLGLTFIFQYDEANSLKQSYTNVLQEMNLVDNIKEKTNKLLTKLKISPVKTISMAQDTLVSSFESIPKDTVIIAVQTVLKTAFFIIVTLGAFTLGLIAIILGLVAKMIYDRYFSNESQMREAIEEMKKHRDEVEYKYQTEVVLNRKERMLEYAQSLNNEIAELERKYEEIKNNPNADKDDSGFIKPGMFADATVLYNQAKNFIFSKK